MSKHSVITTACTALAVLGASLTAAACGSDGGSTSSASTASADGSNQGLPQGSETVELDPAEFTTKIDNPYWPMTPGSKWRYRESNEKDPNGPELTVEVTVTDQTKAIANGVEARVVHDVVSEGGVPVEVTDDWYAQDSAGNIWYLGEQTQEYVNGKPGPTSGSFEAGVDGAQAGIAMPANPEPGLAYRQEYYAGEAEDKAEVLSTAEMVEVPFGQFSGALLTKDLVPLEPDVQELKFYAKDVGPVLTLKVSGGEGREELVSYTPGA
jgi:hypothetical protein